MPTSSWSTMSDLFSLNMFTPKVSDTYSFGSQSNNSLHASIYEIEAPYLTPSSSPQPPSGCSPILSLDSSHSNVHTSASMFFPSMSSPVLLPTLKSSPSLLRSHGDTAYHATIDTPSLLDSSVSFAHMMGRTFAGGSPTSFLSCSSGWDSGIVSEAVALPSLLNTPPSLDTFRKVADIEIAAQAYDSPILDDDIIGLGFAEFASLSFGSITSSARVAIATKVYLSPSLNEISTICLPDTRPLDLGNKQGPRCKNSPEQLLARNVNSVFHSSPASDVTSITSSFYEDPFHWDLVLSGMYCSPGDRDPPYETSSQPSLLTRKSSPPLALPSASSFFHHVCEEVSSGSSEPELTAASSSGSDDIPTIIVMNPEFMSIPIQASISSIVGLYESSAFPVEHVDAVHHVLTLAVVEEEDNADAEDADDWWSIGNGSDGDDSYDENEFEIIAVPALRTRLDTILEEEETENESEQEESKLVTISSDEDGFKIIIPSSSDEASTSTAVATSDMSSLWTTSSGDVTSSGTGPSLDTGSDSFYSQASRRRYLPTSASANSTVRLPYSDSRTSYLEECAHSHSSGSASASLDNDSDDNEGQWLFYVENGAILEVPIIVHGSSPSTSVSKLAEKLDKFPKVPTSPFLSPFTSPLPSSVLTAMREPLNVTPSTSGSTGRNSSGLGLSIINDTVAGMSSSLLTPNWISAGSLALGSSTVLGLGLSGIGNRASTSHTTNSFGIDFQDHDLDLRNGTGNEDIDKAGCDVKEKVEPKRTRERHVRFESSDFRSNIANINRNNQLKRRSPVFTNAKKTWIKKRRVNWLRRKPPVITVTDTDGEDLSSLLSSSSIVVRRRIRKIGFKVAKIGSQAWDGLSGCCASLDLDDDEDSYWERRRRAVSGGVDCRTSEHNPQHLKSQRYAFYERWRNAWS